MVDKREPTPEEKEKFKKLYLSGEKPKAILEKFPDIKWTNKQLSEYFRRQKLIRKKRKINEKVAEKLEQTITEQRIEANKKHLNLFNKSEQLAEQLINEFLTENPKGNSKRKLNAYALNVVSNLLLNLQKGHRIALNMDNTKDTEENTEPQINVINGLDIRKI